MRILKLSATALALASLAQISPLQAQTQEYYSISTDISVSSAQSPNVAHNLIDRDFNTRWSAQGEGESVTFNLTPYALTPDRIGIAWFKGDQRRSNFKLEISRDGVNWETQFAGWSSGKTNQIEWYDVDKSGTFVRIVGYGNSQNNWNSITEVVLDGIDGRDFDGFDNYVFLQGATSDDGNVPENSRDASLATRWSAKGPGQTIDFLSDVFTEVGCVAIAWYNGDKRKFEFDINIGDDSRKLFSSGQTLLPELYLTFINEPSLNYSITGYGNTQNDWNSITEIHFPSATCRDVYNLPLAEVKASSYAASNPVGLAFDNNDNTGWKPASGKGSVTVKFGSLELVQTLVLRTNSKISDIKVSGVYRDSGYLPMGYSRSARNGVVRLHFAHAVLASEVKIDGLTDLQDLKVEGRN